MLRRLCLLAGATLALPLLSHAQLLPSDGAVLRGLDKITGQATDRAVDVGETVIFGSLKVTLRACHQAPPIETPESAAFLQVDDLGLGTAIPEGELTPVSADSESRIFSGWMFASSPGLSALEHPVYDVWVIRCKALSPDILLEYDPSEFVTNDPGSVEGAAPIVAPLDGDMPDADEVVPDNSPAPASDEAPSLDDLLDSQP